MTVHITRWGQAGPTVVCIHGSAQGSTVGGDGHFAQQQVLAERGWQLIVPDRPGHGRSPANGQPDDAELDGAWVADDLLAKVEGGAHLVGHSFGGAVALAAAARLPGAVRSLTLIEPGMQKLASHEPAVRRFGMQLLKIKFLSASAASRARKFALAVGIPPDIGGAKSRAEMSAMGQGIYRLRVPGKAMLQRQLALVSGAGIPLLVVTGGWHPAFEATAVAVVKLGQGRHRIIASPHHFPNKVSDEFNQVLATFMRASDARRGPAGT